MNVRKRKDNLTSHGFSKALDTFLLHNPEFKSTFREVQDRNVYSRLSKFNVGSEKDSREVIHPHPSLYSELEMLREPLREHIRNTLYKHLDCNVRIPRNPVGISIIDGVIVLLDSSNSRPYYNGLLVLSERGPVLCADLRDCFERLTPSDYANHLSRELVDMLDRTYMDIGMDVAGHFGLIQGPEICSVVAFATLLPLYLMIAKESKNLVAWVDDFAFSSTRDPNRTLYAALEFYPGQAPNLKKTLMWSSGEPISRLFRMDFGPLSQFVDDRQLHINLLLRYRANTATNNVGSGGVSNENETTQDQAIGQSTDRTHEVEKPILPPDVLESVQNWEVLTNRPALLEVIRTMNHWSITMPTERLSRSLVHPQRVQLFVRNIKSIGEDEDLFVHQLTSDIPVGVDYPDHISVYANSVLSDEAIERRTGIELALSRLLELVEAHSYVTMYIGNEVLTSGYSLFSERFLHSSHRSSSYGMFQDSLIASQVDMTQELRRRAMFDSLRGEILISLAEEIRQTG